MSASSGEQDLAAPIKRLADLDLSDTKGDAAHYDDANTTYHHQLYTGPIVDPHVHFFHFEKLSYPWLKGPNQVGALLHHATAERGPCAPCNLACLTAARCRASLLVRSRSTRCWATSTS